MVVDDVVGDTPTDIDRFSVWYSPAKSATVILKDEVPVAVGIPVISPV